MLYSHYAPDLVGNDVNAGNDVFHWSPVTNTSTIISKVAGTPSASAGGESSAVRVSEDGRYAVFATNASNILTGYSGFIYGNIYLRDLVTGQATLVSHAHDSLTTPTIGSGNPVISADGRFVAYSSLSNQLVPGFVDNNGASGGTYDCTDVYLWDRLTNTNTLVSRSHGTTNHGGNEVSGTIADFENYFISIDHEGRRVVYRSHATDLVPNFVDASGKDNSGHFGSDIYVFDRLTGQNTLVNHRYDAVNISSDQMCEFPLISGDGRTIAYVTRSSDLVAGFTGTPSSHLYAYDVATGVNVLVSHAASGPAVSATGYSWGYVLSGNGRYVLHNHYGTNLVDGVIDTNNSPDLFLYDMTTGVNELITRRWDAPDTTAGVGTADISDDGRWIAFNGVASRFIPGAINTHSSTLLYDRDTATFTLASHIPGEPLTGPNSLAGYPSISGNGRVVTWMSRATNLVPGMTGPFTTGGTEIQIYAYDRLTDQTTLVTRSIKDPTKFSNKSIYFQSPQVNGTGSVVVFRSGATDLALNDYNGFDDVFAFVTPPPTATVRVGDGSAQRSVVRSLTVTLDQPVLFAGEPASAFVLRRGAEVVPVTASVTVGLTTTVTLTFSGPATQFGSLADGRYTLTVLSSEVTGIEPLDGNADGTPGDDFVFAFHRLFGDADGDARVDAMDFLAFRLGFQNNAPAFDHDGNGTVTASDFLAFRLRFLAVV